MLKLSAPYAILYEMPRSTHRKLSMATQATPDHSPEYLSFQETFEAFVSTFKAQPAAYADSLFSNGYIPDEVLEYSRLNGVMDSNKSRKILDAIHYLWN